MRSPERTQLLQTLVETNMNISRLIENLLSWSKIERGLLKPQFEETDLAKLVNEALCLMEQQRKNKQIDIDFSIEKDILVKTDKHMLQTVLRNLVSNAIKFSFKNKRVAIVAEKTENESIKISVADEGVGMDKHQLFNLFNTNHIYSEQGL